MPPRLPERYRLNIRLGSDGDIEEWLGQDEALDRPVLIRYLAPEASEARHRSFLEGVRAAASLTDIHLQKVFAAAETSASAYSVSEWDGGVAIADRVRVGEGLAFDEFIANAPGLCMALARFHDEGGVHGALDDTAVHYSAAHPAKIGAFGREARWKTQAEDTMALAEVLRAALTGSADPSVQPSHVVDGVPPSIDTTLAAGRTGEIDARAIAGQLAAVDVAAPRSIQPSRPWRALSLFAAIIVAISLIAAVGLASDFDPDSPFLYPVSAERQPPPTVPVPVDEESDSNALPVAVAVYDPFGDGTEEDESVTLAVDGDRNTSWRTEAYSRPIRDFKDGVGLVFDTDGTPTAVYLSGSSGATYVLGWATEVPEDALAWETVGRGTIQPWETRIQLPLRAGGVWRIWLTSLPQRPDGAYLGRIDEVRFVS